MWNTLLLIISSEVFYSIVNDDLSVAAHNDDMNGYMMRWREKSTDSN